MKDYQRKKNNKYILPSAAYMETIYIIRGYARYKDEATAILEESPPPPDGQPRGQNMGDETASKAVRREEYLRKIAAIEQAIMLVPPEYREGVWRNTIDRTAFPNDAARATYGKWKSRFIYEVATRLGIV